MRGGNYDKAVHIVDNRPPDSICLSPGGGGVSGGLEENQQEEGGGNNPS